MSQHLPSLPQPRWSMTTTDLADFPSSHQCSPSSRHRHRCSRCDHHRHVVAVDVAITVVFGETRHHHSSSNYTITAAAATTHTKPSATTTTTTRTTSNRQDTKRHTTTDDKDNKRTNERTKRHPIRPTHSLTHSLSLPASHCMSYVSQSAAAHSQSPERRSVEKAKDLNTSKKMNCSILEVQSFWRSRF